MNHMQATFIRNVENHKMTINQDHGVFRHVAFGDGSSSYMFEIITWPGALTISGDCGTYVFRREEYDMFGFFVSPDAKDEIKINPEYWDQKVVAADRNNDGCDNYPYNFLWSLYAIVWGITEFNKQSKSKYPLRPF